MREHPFSACCSFSRLSGHLARLWLWRTKTELHYWFLLLASYKEICVTQATIGGKWFPICSQLAMPNEPVSPGSAAFPLCRLTAKSVLSFVHFEHFSVHICFALVDLCLEASIYSELRWTVFFTSAWTSAAENFIFYLFFFSLGLKPKYLHSLSLAFSSFGPELCACCLSLRKKQ